MEEPTPSRALQGEAVLEDPLVRELLGLRTVAVLATVEPDGVPYAVPMWHAPGDGCVLLATGSRSRKVRNLLRDPRRADRPRLARGLRGPRRVDRRTRRAGGRR